MFRSVRPSVCAFVCLCVCWHKSATLLSVFVCVCVCSFQGAFKMVGRSKWLLFQKVAPSQSITLVFFLLQLTIGMN